MNRLQADLALGLAGIIWGFGFVAQKNALAYMEPFTFVAAKFFVSALVVLPLILIEKSWRRLKPVSRQPKNLVLLALLCAAFSVGVLFQQYGMKTTNVTKTAFLTGLYVVMVPFIGCLFYRHKLTAIVLIASLLSLAGVWLLSGGKLDHIAIDFVWGDVLVMLCAIGYAVQVVLMGKLASQLQAPFLLSLLQYVAVGLIALLLALIFETIDFNAIMAAWRPILFAGVACGGIAYTLQAIAQQHTPSADAAIILSSEALFGGISGVWLMHDKITFGGGLGCAAIMAAIVLVEIGPLWKWNRKRRSRKVAS